MNKALLKKMVGEVSVSTLGALLIEYAQSITESDDVDEDSVVAIETVIAELRSRAKPDKQPRQKRKRNAEQSEEVTAVIGNGGGHTVESIREEGNLFQR